MIKILIADDHAIVRGGMKQLLLEHFQSVMIGEANDAETLIKKVIEKTWDVVICDLSMPGRGGLDALKQIKQTFPKLPVLIMSMHPEEQYAARALKAGASGYLGKDSIHEQLVEAIRTVLKGRKFITPSVADILVEDFKMVNGNTAYTALSDREFEVLKLLAVGKTVSDIAQKLLLSLTTVSTYRLRILKKLNMRSNAELARYAYENGLI
jgi:DNA-binding NarL/FixJ family response regulator